MLISRSRRALAVLPLAVAAALLTGCTAPADSGAGSSNDSAAVAFVSCLNDAGQTAKILDGGRVGMLMPEGGTDDPPAAGAGSGTVTVSQDSEGTWTAASEAEGYPEVGGMRTAWSGCEEQVPGFTQPEADVSGEQQFDREGVLASSLAFAECARAEGYENFPDPDSDGMLTFPAGFTEESFRALLRACLDTESGLGIALSAESTDTFDFDWVTVMQEFGAAGGVMGATTPGDAGE